MDTEPQDYSEELASKPVDHPSDIDAERRLLHSLLVEINALDIVAEFLEPKHFADPINGQIYEAMFRVREETGTVTLELLTHHLSNDENTNAIAFPPAVKTGRSSVFGASECAKRVFDFYLRRQLVAACRHAISQANVDYDVETVTEQIEGLEQWIYDIAHEFEITQKERGFHPFKNAMLDFIDDAQAAHLGGPDIEGAKFSQVDASLGKLSPFIKGFCPGEVFVVAGASPWANSVWAIHVAYQLARDYLSSDGEEGASVGYFSTSNSAKQVAGRIMANDANLPYADVVNGDLSAGKFSALVESSLYLYWMPLHMDAGQHLTVSGLRNRVRKLKRTTPLGLLIVDGVETLTRRRPGEFPLPPGRGVIDDLKRLAKELYISILVTSSVSLKHDAVADGLAEELRATADVLLELRPNGGVLSAQELEEVEAEVVKNAHGKTGIVHLPYDPTSELFVFD